MEGFLVPGDEDPIADAIRKAIGAGTYDLVGVRTPQFHRTDGVQVSEAPNGIKGFDILREIPKEWLLSLGLRIWNTKDNLEHWLYPAEWYSAIPAGYEIVDINGERELFVPGKTDNDQRGGMLAYGFIRNIK
jgi:hypothetical protein